jgi:hypothetical protein
MKAVITKEREKPLVRIPRTRRPKTEGIVISPTRHWKLLYSPVTKGYRPRPDAQEKDLCATCRDSARCTYPKPEAGVWHCAAYKWEAK